MPAISHAVVLVTGAAGGLGGHFVSQALERGAAKVYAATRRPSADSGDPRLVPLLLDVTSPASIAAAAEAAGDVSVLINNAGVSNGSGVMGDLAPARELFETNFWAQLAVADAFAPALRAQRGVLLNVLSALSWMGRAGAYSAAKAALWSATNTQRLLLAPDGVHVAGLHAGFIDTPMTARIDAPKSDPADIVRAAYDGIEAGDFEILADDTSREVKAALSGPVEALYPEVRR
ncbi:SDR family oxidoreductase [Microbacterium sp. RD1]|uniref:SDR family oxidoreductase n=1 Tax=Microbacterium sp. RD1 TaxID=3457313 RepID=UPI003FA5EC84